MDWQSRTALSHAVESGDIEIVRLILAFHVIHDASSPSNSLSIASFNLKSTETWEAPMDIAVRNKCHDIEELLHSCGASLPRNHLTFAPFAYPRSQLSMEFQMLSFGAITAFKARRRERKRESEEASAGERRSHRPELQT